MNLTDKINSLLNIVDKLEIERRGPKVHLKAWIQSSKWEQSAELDELESAVTRLYETVVFEVSQRYRKG